MRRDLPAKIGSLMTFTLILELVSVFSATAAAALWTKSAAIVMPVPRSALVQDRRASGPIASLGPVGETTLPLSADVELARLGTILRTQSRWNSLGARFAALAVLCHALALIL